MSAPDSVDVNVPNAARMYDYYLGGKDNFAVDRAAAEAVLGVAPEIRDAARAGRALVRRVVRHMVAECGLRQIVDIGSGLPTGENVHEIAQAVDPSVRVVYVDPDQMVCIHGRALLASDRTAMVRGDIRDPEGLWADPELRDLIDLGEPVGVLMMFVLHLIGDEDHPQEVVERHRRAVAPGSMLAVSHATNDARPDFMARVSAIYEQANVPFVPRGHADIKAFFGDWPLVEPGLVNVWPYPGLPGDMHADLARTGYSGVARKH